MGISMERKIKGVFQNAPSILAGPVNKLLFYGEGGCLVLGVSPVAGVGEGSKERETGACTSRRLQDYGVLPVRRDAPTVPEQSGRILWDHDGDCPKFWPLPPALPSPSPPRTASAVAQAPIASRSG